jgi:thioredoxin reductase (NADPH)
LFLDKNGFVVTGSDLVEYENLQWPLSRSPLLLETSVPGIFAVGDTRAGSIKRVASAVGEGAMAVQLVHRFLAESTEQDNAPGSRRTDLAHGIVDSLPPKIRAQGEML